MVPQLGCELQSHIRVVVSDVEGEHVQVLSMRPTNKKVMRCLGIMYIEMTCGQSPRENYASPIASSKIDKKT
jgi:hypothetical protein